MKLKILLITILLLVPNLVFASRTDNYWDNIGTYIKTNFPTGYNILINGVNKYLNFNTISGSAGYGIRDNGGTIEIKNSGGAWNDVVTASTSIGSAYQVLNTNESGIAEWTYDLGSATQRLGTIYSDYLRTKWLEVSQNVIDNSFKIGSSTNALSTNLLFSNSFGDSSLVYDTDGAFKFSTASYTNALTILNNGNVGIGTTNPQATLHVKGTDTEIARFVRSDNDNNYLSFRNSGTGSFGMSFVTAIANLQLNGNTRLSINSSGVGIDTTSQVNSFGVSGSASIGTSYVNTPAPTNGMIIQGNVGIGTPSPLSKLNVSGTQVTQASLIDNEDLFMISKPANAPTESMRAVFGLQKWSASNYSRTQLNIGLRNENSEVNVMSLRSDGNVGIGTTNPNEKLSVNGGMSVNGDGVYATYTNNTYSDTSWHGARIAFNRSRGTKSAPSTVIANDTIGWFDYFGRDGSSLQRVGRFALFVDGTVSSGVVPGRFVFSTVGTSGFLSDRLTLYANDNVSMANNGGNVGIGTTNPSLAKFQIEAGNGVVGQYIKGGTSADTDLLKLRANAPTQRLILEGTGGTVQTFLEAGASIGLFGTVTNHDFRIRTNYVDRMTFDTAGNVGIGKTNPEHKLDVQQALNENGIIVRAASSSSQVGAWLKLNNDGSGWSQIDSKYGFRFKKDGEMIAFIDNKKANGFRLYDDVPLSFGTSAARFSLGKSSVSGNLILSKAGDFDDPSKSVLSITTTGDVGIGTISPLEKLEVNGNIKVSGNMLKMTGITTATRDGLTAVAGDIIYNTTTNKHQGYDGTNWNDLY